LDALPDVRPRYREERLDPYQGLADVGADEASDPHHFAPSLVREIIRTPGQELGTHTFSHYCCLEPGQTPEAFRADFTSAVKVAGAKFGVTPRSLVFPRNQFNPAYLSLCAEQGIVAFRGNQASWLYQAKNGDGETLVRRGSRL